jgi:hypothetical protein
MVTFAAKSRTIPDAPCPNNSDSVLEICSRVKTTCHGFIAYKIKQRYFK